MYSSRVLILYENKRSVQYIFFERAWPMELKPGRCLLHQRLRSLKKSQKWLSDKTGIPPGRISEYISGGRMMNLITAKKISVALECDMDSLYEWYWE
jgi:putative transcriptional regulator